MNNVGRMSISISGTNTARPRVDAGYAPEQFTTTRASPTEVGKSSALIEAAVYQHIQAIRALGRKTISTVDISRALSLPLRDVDNAVKGLRDKGVKVL